MSPRAGHSGGPCRRRCDPRRQDKPSGRRLADADDDHVAGEQPLGDAPDIFDRHSRNQILAAIDVIDAEIVELDR
ncbi:hypothetical protein D3C83_57370 [compost metagenome]